jgi:hypothetical protein
VIVARIHAEGQWHPGAIDLQGALRPHESLLSRLPRLLGDFLARDERTVEADQGAIEALALHEKVQEGAADAQVGLLTLTPNSFLSANAAEPRGNKAPSPSAKGRVPRWRLGVRASTPQKFNTFNTFGIFAKFAKFAKFANFDTALACSNPPHVPSRGS